MSDEPPDTLTDLSDWYRYLPPPDPPEQMRREIGEQQRRNVKRRKRRPKTQPKGDTP